MYLCLYVHAWNPPNRRVIALIDAHLHIRPIHLIGLLHLLTFGVGQQLVLSQVVVVVVVAHMEVVAVLGEVVVADLGEVDQAFVGLVVVKYT